MSEPLKTGDQIGTLFGFPLVVSDKVPSLGVDAVVFGEPLVLDATTMVITMNEWKDRTNERADV